MTPHARRTLSAPGGAAACRSCPTVQPGSASSTERGNSLRTSRLPSNGVAASSVSSISRALLILLPFTLVGVLAGAFQYRHGALNQALPQVSNGAMRLMRVLSLAHLAQLSGHCTSVHCTALYTANPLSLPSPSEPLYSATRFLAALALWVFSQSANAEPSWSQVCS